MQIHQQKVIHTTTQLSACLHKYYNFNNVELDTILSAFELISCKDRDVLINSNKVCNQLFFVLKGVLRIASINEKGIEVTHYFYKEEQFCTILQSFNDETASDAFIQACCDSDVLVISRKKLFALYETIPALRDVIVTIQQEKMIEKVNTRNLYLGSNALDIYKQFLLHQPDIALRVSQKDIAGYLGITPQSLSRLRRQMH